MRLKKKRMLAALIAVLMIITVLPLSSITARADAVNYGTVEVILGDKRPITIRSDNKMWAAFDVLYNMADADYIGWDIEGDGFDLDRDGHIDLLYSTESIGGYMTAYLQKSSDRNISGDYELPVPETVINSMIGSGYTYYCDKIIFVFDPDPEDTVVVTPDNFFEFFDDSGYLTDTVHEELIFKGSFAAVGVDTVTIPYSIKLSGDKASFNGTSFCITGDDVTLSGLGITYNGFAAIEVRNCEGAVIENCNIVSVPQEDVDGYAVYAENVTDFTVINNYIKYTGNTEGSSVNAGLYVTRSDGGESKTIVVQNNTFDLTMPSVYVPWVEAGSGSWEPRIVSQGVCFNECSEVNYLGNSLTLTPMAEPYGTYTCVYGAVFYNRQVNTEDSIVYTSTISGNSFDVTGLEYAYDVMVNGGMYLLTENEFKAKSSCYAYAIDAEDTDGTIIRKNEITAQGDASAYGVYASTYESDKGPLSILENEIYIDSPQGYGILSWGTIASLEISGNLVSETGDHLYGIGVTGETPQALITNNTIETQGSNTEGISLGWESSAAYNEEGMMSCGIYLDNPASVSQNEILTTGTGVYAKKRAEVTKNTVNTTYDYTVNVNDTASVVTYNGLSAAEYTGDESVLYTSAAEVHDNTDAKESIDGKKVVLSASSFTYNGKVQKPSVKTIGGKTLKSGTDYTVTYSKASPKDPGLYTVTVKGKGSYTGTTSASYRILFKDVPLSHNFQKHVYWALDRGIAAGYTGAKMGLFGINDDITRGQVMMFLWRANGKPEPKKHTQTFKDVPTTNNFYKAIQWGVEQGITGGYTGDRTGYFGLNDNCTRGQIATFLWRNAGKPAPKKNTQTFKDVPVKNNFYKAIQWAAEEGITAGYSDGTFGINKTCTRGHCVTFLHRQIGD